MAVFRRFQHILKATCLTFLLCISSAFAVVPTLHPNGCFDSVADACGDNPNTCIATPDANNNPRVFIGWSISANGGGIVSDVTADLAAGATDVYAMCTTGTFAVRVSVRSTSENVFRFSLSAKGNFTVDYGDGTVEQIVRTDTTAQEYSHPYSAVGDYIVKFGGVATEYNSSAFDTPAYFLSGSYNWDWSHSAISFYTRRDDGYTDAAWVDAVYGSLGSIFPTIGVTAQNPDPTVGLASNSAALLAIQPRFAETFAHTHLGTTGGYVPDNLFDGIVGQAADNMFTNTFCMSRVRKIPSGLFSGITGAAKYLFGSTFDNSNLMQIPSSLFSGITGAAEGMFARTFRSNVYLKSIPSGLFSGVEGAATGMFRETFYGANEYLTSIPSGLFSGVDGAATSMFRGTFGLCTKLESVPSDLFSGVSGAAIAMFMETFKGCRKLTTVPSDLFSGVTGVAGNLFYATFASDTYADCGLTSIPSDLFSGVSGGNAASGVFEQTFSGCKYLAQIEPVGSVGLFSGITTAGAYMFSNTFYNCQSLTTVPSNMFATSLSLGQGSNYAFQGMFQNSGLTSIPSGLFDGVNDTGHVYVAAYTFKNTFAGCTDLTSIPENLFPGITDAGVQQFYGTFAGCTSLTALPKSLFPNITGYSTSSFEEMFDGDTNLSGYVHADLFGNLSDSVYTASSTAMNDIFMNTNLDTVCPAGGYETVSTNFSVDWSINSNGDKAVMCRPISYAIHAYLNSGSIDTLPSSYDCETPTFTVGAPTRAGYTFDGWCVYDSSSNDGANCAEPQQSVTFTNGVTTGDKWLYAKWTVIYYTIHYDLDGGTNPVEYYSFTYSDEAKVLEHPTKVDYAFAGWCVYNSATNDGANCDTVTNSIPRNIGDLWLYATWTPITYPFTMTTTTETADFSFGLTINAIGTFYIDWGDGTATEKVNLYNYGNSPVNHNYTVTDTTNGQHFTVRLGGSAVARDGRSTYSTNSVNNSSGAYTVLRFTYPTKLAGISGSLGAVFPTIGGASATRNKTAADLAKIQPSFSNLFNNCTNLTGPIPSTLFDGVVGQPLPYMFYATFYETKMTGSIPVTLFSGINGTPTDYLFASTFGYCNKLTGEIPATLFGGISGEPAPSMFRAAFYGCTNLGRDAIEDDPNTPNVVENAPKYSIPAELFIGISGEPKESMFAGVFYGCSGLAGTNISDPHNVDGAHYAVPPTLFSGIKGAPAAYMFSTAFAYCSGLTGSIPAELFSGIHGDPANSMYYQTFDNCTNLGKSTIGGTTRDYFVPATLFSGINTGTTATNQMTQVFYNTGLMMGGCPSNTDTYTPEFNNDNFYVSNGYAKFCIKYQDVICDAANTLSGPSCSGCSGDSCPVSPTLYTCPDGYTGNTTHDECSPIYTIHYELNGGTTSARTSYDLRTNTFSITTSSATKTGYSLAGWCVYDSASNDGVNCETPQTSVTFTKGVTTGDKWLYAKWTPTVYSIYYYLYNGTVATANPTTYTIETPTITLNNPTHPGYESFAGWCASSYNSCSNPQQTMTIPTGSTGTKYFAAKYSSPIDYNISYELNGGTLASSNPTTYNVETGTFSLNNPTKSGHVFVAWCEDSALTTGCSLTKNVTKGSMGNKAFYAKYMEENYSFQMTTTNLSAGARIDFYITASGNFLIDCGEDGVLSRNGTVIDGKLVVRQGTDNYIYNSGAMYRCTYSTTGGVKTIRFGGSATGYDNHATINNAPAFMTGSSLIASISGSLGAVFPTIGATENYDPTAGLDPTDDADAAVLNSIQPSFKNTFDGCSNLTEIPEELFNGIVGQPVSYMFFGTFENCSGLTGIPAGLFSGIKGKPARSMFARTFSGCSKLTGSIPAELFSGISGAPVPYMFYETFAGCTNLTGEIPATLFSGIHGGPADDMFMSTFASCTNLGKSSIDGASTYYIPPTLFSGISKETTASNQMNSVFYNTGLLTTCPYGTSVYTTDFESNFSSKVSCIRANEVICPANQSLTGSARTCAPCSGDNCPVSPQLYTCPSGYASSDHVSCDVELPFVMTTTSLTANDTSNNYFAFQISASGTFYIDWGDGVVEQIVKNDTYAKIYAHAYDTDGVKTVRLGGVATGYNTTNSNSKTYSAIVFNYLYSSEVSVHGNVSNVSVGSNNNKLASISGSLGAIFPTIGVTAQNPDPTAGLDPVDDYTTLNAMQPLFSETFAGCTNLTGTIPQDLFTGIVGQPRAYMFNETFYACSKLTGSIPATLFSGIKGKPARSMFSRTFYLCSGLGRDAIADDPNTSNIVENAPKYSIPATLFSGINGEAASSMFSSTFSGCYGLTGAIPEDLFGRVVDGTYYGIYGYPNSSMFDSTFAGCSSLTGAIPENLFGRVVNGTYYGIDGDPANYMFYSTFSNCSGLGRDAIADDPNTPDVIENAPKYSIPENLFGRVVNGTYHGVKGYAASYMFNNTFNGCSGLTGEIPANLFGGVQDVADGNYYAYNTVFNGCTNLGTVNGTSTYYIPANLMQRSMMSNYNAFYNTGLQQSCPSNMNTYYTTNNNYKVSCIEKDSIVCPAGTRLENGVCTECSGDDCLVVRSVVSCAPGTNLSDFSACVYPYTITYENMDGATLSGSNPVQYYYNNNEGYYYYRTSLDSTNWTSQYYSYYSLSKPTKPDAEFVGWYDNNDNKANTIYFDQNKDMTLYAKWEYTYNINYELNGGDWGNYGWSNPNPSTYTNLTGATVYYGPQRSGYVFVGWCDNEELTNSCDTYKYIDIGKTGNRTFWAKWELQQTTCPAGQYAYFSGETGCDDCAEHCKKCEPGYYCTGRNATDGGTLLTAYDNGRYSCPSSRANSSQGATSLADCKIKCPTPDFGFDEESSMADLGSALYDLDGDGTDAFDECVTSVFAYGDSSELQKCALKMQMTDAQIISRYGSKYYYEHGFDKPCDYIKANMGMMTCRYDTVAGDYTKCSKMLAACSDADFQTVLSIIQDENNNDTPSKDLLDVELTKKGLDKNTIDWDDFFVQNSADITSTDDIIRDDDIGTCEPEGYKYCPETKYYSVSAADCVDCPAGSYCVGGLYATDSVADAGIEACSGDTYSEAKASSCIQCPAGISTANQNHTSCVCTNSGFAYDPDNNICYIPSCDTENTLCCGSGNYIVVDTDEDYAGCEWCDSGYYCPGVVEPIVSATNGEGKIACEDGYYSEYGASVCTACPAGSTSNADHTSCICPAGYKWSRKTQNCEFTECPETRIVKHSNTWDNGACYNEKGSLIEDITTEAECLKDYEWRDNKCFVRGTDKEITDIVTKFGCEYEFDANHIMAVPMSADLNGDKKESIDECVLLIEGFGNPQAASQAEMDVRLGACRYNTTTKDYTDCSISLGVCSEQELMAMAAGAQTEAEMFTAILNSAKTKFGSATWDAFFNRDFTSANYTTLIDNASGVITMDIINQDSFSMCCPAGQYLLNDNGVAACDTCPTDPANTYCPGGTYETSATAGALQCPAGTTANLDHTACDCSEGYEWSDKTQSCEFSSCPNKTMGDPNNGYVVLSSGYMDFGAVNPNYFHFSYDFDNNGEDVTDCMTMVVKADDFSQIQSNPSAAGIRGTSFCRYDTSTRNYTDCATPLKACNKRELSTFMNVANNQGGGAAFNIFAEFAGKESPSDVTFGNSISSLADGANCLASCPASTKTFENMETAARFMDLNGDNVADEDECVVLAMSADDMTEAGKCMNKGDCDWATAGLKLFACRYDTQDYNNCSEALSFCDRSYMQIMTDVPDTPSMSARYLAMLRNARTKMGLSNTNPDWNNDFFTVDMSSQSTITNAVVSEYATNCMFCPVNANETVSLADGYVDVGAMASRFVLPYDFDNDGESMGDCVKMVAQWNTANSETPTAISYCKYDTDTETYFGSCATPVPTCTNEELGTLVETNDPLGAFATQSNVQSPSDLSFDQSGGDFDTRVSCCPADSDPAGVTGSFLIKDPEYIESLSSCAKAYVWVDKGSYKMAVCKYNNDTNLYDTCAALNACTADLATTFSSANQKTSDLVNYINTEYNKVVGTDVDSIIDTVAARRCPCDLGYDWNSSKYMCEFAECPETRIVKHSNTWDNGACYNEKGSLIEDITTEAECLKDYEWRDNKCFVRGTDKEITDIVTKFGCEYEFDANHIMAVPMSADLNGDKKESIDECVLLIEGFGNPQAASQAEMDVRLGACRYNTTTKDYTDCSISLGVCSEQELMAMAAGAQTEAEMFTAILNSAKTKFGSATWDAFFNRDFTSANYTTLIDNASGVITMDIINQDSFSMCCPAGQYLLNDNGVAACDTCPTDPANTYCPGGTYETSATAGALQCPAGTTVNQEQTACDCSALGGSYHWDTDTKTCAACPLGSRWNSADGICEVISCKKPQQSYTDPAPINTQGGPGVMEVSNNAIRKSYGATENECAVMRIYYETSTPLMEGENIENYVAAGASIAFCRYDSNTGSYDNKCTKKYTFCADDSMEDFAAAIQTNGAASLMQYAFGVETEEEIAALFTEESADLADEAAVNRCCPDGFVCCSAGTYIDQENIGTANQCPTCEAGSYCPGIEWDSTKTFDSGKRTCGVNTYNATVGAISAAACLTCPDDYPLAAIGTGDIAQCYATCPQEPVCVDNATESGCVYVDSNQTTKTFGNMCGTNVNSCDGGYTPTSVATWVQDNWNKMRPLSVCYLDDEPECSRTISDTETITLKAGQFAVAFNDSPITNARGYASCNGTQGNTNSVAARITDRNFVPTANGANCWVKWSQMDDMEVNASWVFVTTYADEAECASSCGELMDLKDPYPYQQDVLAALVMDTAQNQIRICDANTVNIEWGGVDEPGAAGMCTYGKDLTTPQSEPEQENRLFLGWKPVSTTNNENNANNDEK